MRAPRTFRIAIIGKLLILSVVLSPLFAQASLSDSLIALLIEHSIELALPDEKDVDQFAVIHFDVGQQPDLFKEFVVESLGFIDDQQNFFIGGGGIVQKMLQMDQKSALAVKAPVHIKLFSQKIKKVDAGESRIRNVGHNGGNIDQLDQAMD